MQQLPTAFNFLLRRGQKRPVYLIEFEGLTTRYATGAIKDPQGPTKPWLRVPEGAGAQITPDEGRASIGTVNFSILDVGGAITRLAFLYQMASRVVTIRAGFEGLPETSFATIFAGRVLNYKAAEDTAFWKFTVTDFQKDTRQQIFTAKTAITVAAGVGDATINVSNTASFKAATLGAAAGQFYIRIDDEAIAYTGKTGTTFTGCTRGVLGTTAATHDVDAVVSNLVVLEGNPLDIALWILTSTGAGTNGAYDLLPASCGLAIPVAYIDVARIERERNRWTSGTVFQFFESDAQPGKSFLEEQIYQCLPAYPIRDNKGRLAVRVAAPPLPTEVSFSLDDDNIVKRPTFAGNVLDRYFFNELDLQFDHDFLTGKFRRALLFEDAASQTLFDQVKTKTIQSRGIRTGVTTESRIERFSTLFIKRYGTPSPIISAKAFFSTMAVEPGDVLPLSSSKLPNLDTGTIGVVAKLVEVIGVQPLWKEGAFQYSLLDTPYSYGRRYAGISPSAQAPGNFPTYDLATPQQRGYAFFSEKVNNTRGIMSNGDDGYYITP